MLIKQVSGTFEAHLPALMAGTFSNSLIDSIPSGPAIGEAYSAVKERVFAWDRTVSAEIAGAQMITDVLERLILAVKSPKSLQKRDLAENCAALPT